MYGTTRSCNLFKNRRYIIVVLLFLVVVLSISISIWKHIKSNTSEILVLDEQNPEYERCVEFVLAYKEEFALLSSWFAENILVLESEITTRNNYNYEGNYHQDEEVTNRIIQSFPEDIKNLYDEMQREYKFNLYSLITKSYNENIGYTGKWEIKNPILYMSYGDLYIGYFYDTSNFEEKYKDARYHTEDYTYAAFADALMSCGEMVERYTKINDNIYVAETHYMGT